MFKNTDRDQEGETERQKRIYRQWIKKYWTFVDRVQYKYTHTQRKHKIYKTTTTIPTEPITAAVIVAAAALRMKWNEISVYRFCFFYNINYLMKHIVNSLTQKRKQFSNRIKIKTKTKKIVFCSCNRQKNMKNKSEW